MAQRLRPYSPSSKADTCLWCGEALLHEPVYATDARGHSLRPRQVAGYTEQGGYAQNGAFCTVGCGYQFGLAVARMGQRLQPVDRTPRLHTEHDPS